MRLFWKWTMIAGACALVAAAGIALAVHSLVGEPSNMRSEMAAVFVTQSAEPLGTFHRDNHRYPTTDEGLNALLRYPSGLKKTWRGPYLNGTAPPSDPWKHEFRYRCPGRYNPRSYDIWIVGPDGIESDDDIGNWPDPHRP